MRARRASRSVASIIYRALALLATGCVPVEDAPPEPDAADVVLVDPSESMPGADAPLTAPPGEPRNSEPACDDAGDCCPEGTTPVLGTQNADVFSTSAQGLCHVTLGGGDVVNNTSAAGLHAALGGPGTDTLYGGFGPAILAGGDDGDTLTGRNNDDELYGQGGNDNLYGNGGNDKGFGGDGNDSISLGEGNNEADGGHGADTLNTGGGADVLRGGPDNDVLNAGGGADDLRGNGGDDTLNGQGGNDTLVGGPAKDIVNAGSGDDLVIVYDVCELVSGEVYNGEGGTDTLQIPVTLAEVEALGVVVTGFENVVVGKHSCLSECVAGNDCSGAGTCVPDGSPDGFHCACDWLREGEFCETTQPVATESGGPGQIQIRWVDVQSPDQVTTLPSTIVTFEVENKTTTVFIVTTLVYGEMDGNRVQQQVGQPPLEVPPLSTLLREFDITEFGLDPGDLRYSAYMVVRGAVFTEGPPQLSVGTVFSENLYFHGADDGQGGTDVVVYGRSALLDQFRGGDFAFRRPALPRGGFIGLPVLYDEEERDFTGPGQAFPPVPPPEP